MMKLLGLATVLLAVPASAQTSSGAAIQAPTAAADTSAAGRPKDKMICRTMAVTGSRLGGRRECMTAAQWDARRKQDREWLEQSDRKGKISQLD